MAQFPSHTISQDDKINGKAFTLDMAKAMWSEFKDTSKSSFNKGADRYALNKLYSIGKQPSDRYQPMFEIAEDQDSSFINLDLSPPAIIPKYKRIILNKFAKLDFTMQAQAIDPFALEDRNDYEAEERANIKTRGILNEVGLPDDVLKSGEIDQPMDDEELAIKMEFGYKHNMAIDIEKRIDAIFKQERIHDKLVTVRDSLFDTGVSAIKTYTDVNTGKVGLRVVDSSNLIVSPTRDPFFSDIWYAGEATLMTVDEIRNECEGDEIDEEKFEELARKNAGQNGNPAYFPGNFTGEQSYDSFKIPVLDFEVISLDTEGYEKRKDTRGNPVIGKRRGEKTKTDREYFDDETFNVYRGKWIIDSELVFNHGLKSDVVRKASAIWDTRLSYHIVAPELSGMETQPIIENIIPIVDQITLAWYKLQNVIARARPKGIAIEIGAFEDVSLGDAGENMTPLQLLDMFTQTGTLVFRRMNMEGVPTNYRPIEELTNGLGTEAQEYFAVIANYMSMIRDNIGFNEITDGSTPDSKTLNGVAAHAAEGTNNAIHHLLQAERFLLERVADDIAVRVHDSITLKEKSIYANILGPQTTKSLKEDKNHLHREYGIFIEYTADPSEQAKFEMELQRAQELGQINIADKVAIKNVNNRKQAELLLAHRVKKNQAVASANKEKEQMTNAQASAMAAQAAEKAKQETLQIQAQLADNSKRVEYELKKELMMLEYQLKGGIKMGEDQTKKEVADKNSEATKYSADVKARSSAVS